MKAYFDKAILFINQEWKPAVIGFAIGVLLGGVLF
jgi:hypothetical protein